MTFPRSSNLGIVKVLFNGTIFGFEVTNFITKCPHLETNLKYTTAAWADIDASEKPCK